MSIFRDEHSPTRYRRHGGKWALHPAAIFDGPIEGRQDRFDRLLPRVQIHKAFGSGCILENRERTDPGQVLADEEAAD